MLMHRVHGLWTTRCLAPTNERMGVSRQDSLSPQSPSALSYRSDLFGLVLGLRFFVQSDATTTVIPDVCVIAAFRFIATVGGHYR